MSELIRFGVSIDEKLLKKFDQLIEDGYTNRSEAIRDLIRDKIVEEKCQDEEEDVVGTLTLFYDHHQRGTTEKMMTIQHDYYSLFKSNLHLHLSHHICLEVIIVEGKRKKLNEVTQKLIGLRGVKHGKLTVSAVDESL
ncbi:nickel-responsive transcriptional regulator NikR [Natroniella acetigena]|uniref:nickel-responsive transcriptional regulator NikR n=1 Tax=Natroniella acetigena TaxID=52004 RepID=UPI00200AC7FD|nr:nickel-responsive transcriptional regulator NikR [Natroniella acetigena]MCK8827161.1 nickel-responsive transcriptional regulator NikR [Natroniella acetigena]